MEQSKTSVELRAARNRAFASSWERLESVMHGNPGRSVFSELSEIDSSVASSLDEGSDKTLRLAVMSQADLDVVIDRSGVHVRRAGGKSEERMPTGPELVGKLMARAGLTRLAGPTVLVLPPAAQTIAGYSTFSSKAARTARIWLLPAANELRLHIRWTDEVMTRAAIEQPPAGPAPPLE